MWVPPISALMPQLGLEAVLQRLGTRITWFKSHLCPCTGGGSDPATGYLIPGSPDPACRQCNGYGVYWDAPLGPFTGLITYFASAPSPIEPGIRVDEKFGGYIDSMPVLTIPYAAPTNAASPGLATAMAQCWQQANFKDLFCEVDATTRFDATLTQGGVDCVPFQQNLSIQPQGAVTVRDPVNRTVDVVQNYVVSGAQVTLPAGVYPDGTSYVVEFIAAPLFVAFNKAGGLPHIRPFGNATQNLPRRFHLQTLDYWTRENVPNAGTSYPMCGC